MTAIPTVEPALLIAGDTWQWRREDLADDYPANDGWSLSYQLINASQRYQFSATADGAFFAVSVAASTTAGYAAGLYALAGRVTKGAEKHTVFTGSIRVKPDLAGASAAVDTRSHARKVLESIEALIEGRRDVQDYTIGDRSLKKMPIADLLKWRAFYRGEVAREIAANQIAKGQGDGRLILTRFPAR